jgi:hypothetical protein
MANEFVVKNGLITPTVQLPGATSGSITISAPPVAGTTTIALPATAGTIVTTGDTGTVTNAMLAGSIANDKLVNSTISGTALGSTLPTLTLSVSGTGLAGSATYNATGAATFTVTSNATSANTASTIVSRDASGNFVAGTITAALVGNASTATTLQTARTISLSGDVVGSVSFDGSGNANIATTIQADSVALGTDTTGNYVATVAVSGTGLSVTGSGSETAAVTITSNATNANTASTIVARDASGNFVAGTITAALSGNATTASALQTARTISLTGDVIGSVSFDGSGNAAISTTIQPDSVALGTDTTGNYMVNVTAGTGVSVSHTQGEGSTATVSIGQPVGTTDNVTFNNVTVNGTLTSDDITSANINVTGNATITGNLTVSGTTTTVNSTTVALADLNLELARNAANAAQANGAGITVTGPTTAATFTYTSADDRWNLNKNLNVTTVFGALSGNATTASTWQTARTLSFTGDATGSMSVNGSADVSAALTLANSGVTAGTYNNVTVNSKGLVTSGSNVAYLTSYSESDTLATVTARGNSTSASLALTGTNPISLQGNSNNATYTQSVIYANQNNTSANDSNGIFIERGRITDSSSAEIRNFVIGARGGQIQWKLDGSGNTSQTGRAVINYANSTISAATSAIQIENATGNQSSLHFTFAGTQKASLRIDSGGSYVMNSNNNDFYFNNDFGGSTQTLYSVGTAFATITSNYLTGVGSLRAPIFYDSANTSYYVDPNSGTSAYLAGIVKTNNERLVLRDDSIEVHATDNDTAGIAMNYYGYASGTTRFRNFNVYDGKGNNRLNVYGQNNYTQATGSLRAPLFYDSDNTAYYTDPNTATSANFYGSVNAATYNLAGLLVNASGSASTGGAIAIQQVTSEGWTGIFTDYEPYTGWGLWHDNPNNYFLITAESDTANIASNSVPSRSSGNRTAYTKFRFQQGDAIGIAGGSWRAPIFYDSNDTTYYLDPNGKSELNSLDLGYTSGQVYNTAGQGTLFFNNHGEGDIQGYSIGTTLENYGGNYTKLTLDWHTGIKIGASYGYGGIRFYNNSIKYYGGSEVFSIAKGDNHIRVENNLYAPILYDLNDTAYYVDPASTSRLLTIRNSRFEGSDGTFVWRVGSGSGTTRHINLSDSTNDPSNVSINSGITWGERTDNYPYYLIYAKSQYNNGYSNHTRLTLAWHTGIEIGAAPSYGGTRFFNNSPFTGSDIFSVGKGDNHVRVENNLYAPILYDLNNTGYYVDPASTDYSARLAGNLYFTSYPKIGIEDAGMDCYLYITDQNPTVDGIGYGGEFYFYGDKSISSSYLNFGGAIVENILRANSSLRAPIFYDSNDTNYYLDPASSSKVNHLLVNGGNARASYISGTPFNWTGSAAQYFWNRVATLGYEDNIVIEIVAKTDFNYRPMVVAIASFNTWNGTAFSVKLDTINSSDITIDVAFDNSNQCWVRAVVSWNCYLKWRIIHNSGATIYESGVTYQEAQPTNSIVVGTGQQVRGTYGNVTGASVTTGDSHYVSGLTARSDVRAPVFYDSNDTGYYLDANSTGVALRIAGAIQGNHVAWTGEHNKIQWHSAHMYFQNMSDGYWIFRRSNGSEPFQLHADGWGQASGDWRAPRFYDSNDTAYYTDPASTSNLVGLTVANTITGSISGNAGNTSSISNAVGGSYTWTGVQYFRSNLGSTSGSLSSPPLQAYAEGGNSAFMSFHRSGSYAVNFGLDSDNVLRIGGWSASANRWELNMGGDNTVAGSFRAPIFYDSNDTNYFIDPASTSDSALRMRGGALFGPNTTWGAYLYVGGNGRVGTSASVAVTNGNLHIDSQNGYALYLNWYSTNNIYTQANLGIGSDSASYRLHVHGAGYATSDFRAPIFIDSNDTGYYVDPNSSSRLYQTVTNVSYFGTDTNKGYAQGYGTYSSQLHKIARITFDWDSAYNSENHGIFSTDINGAYSDDMSINSFNDINLRIDSNDNDGASYVRFHMHTTGNNEFAYIGYDGGSYLAYFAGSTRSPIFYDSQDTNYYLDANSTSRLDYLRPNRISIVGSYDWGAPRWDFKAYVVESQHHYGQTSTQTMYIGEDNYINIRSIGEASGSLRAPIFYDSNDTSYYVDPNGAGPSAALASSIYLGTQNTDGVSWDYSNGASYRPGIQIRGQYPHIDLIGVISNNNHGPTLRFMGYDNGSSGAYKHWVIGTAGSNVTFLDIGFTNNASNPHEGISGYGGTTLVRMTNDSRVGIGGDWGAYGSDANPLYNLHFVGSNNATNGHAAFFDNRVNATNNGAGFLFRNLYGNHSWGIVAEIRIEGSAGTDRPSLLFSTGYNTDTWSVGFGSTDSNFRIKYDHGHRNGGWGTTAVEVDRGSNMWAYGSMRSPIFYNHSNTGYYVDGDSTSVLYYLSLQGGNATAQGQATSVALKIAGYQNYESLELGIEDSYQGVIRSYGNDIRYYAGHWKTTGNTATEDHSHYWYTSKNGSTNWSSAKMRLNHDATLSVTGDMRAPIFYDSDNTGYYIDPNNNANIAGNVYIGGWFRNYGTSGLYNESYGNHWYATGNDYWNLAGNNGTNVGIIFRTGGHQGTSRGYVYADSSNNIGFLNNSGSWRLRVVDGDYTLADGSSMRAQIFYDSNDTDWYVDANNISRLKHIDHFSNYGYFRGANRATNDWVYGGLSTNPTVNDYSDGSWYVQSNASNWDRGLLSHARYRRVEGLTFEYEVYITSGSYAMIGFTGGDSTSYNYGQTPANLTYHYNAGLTTYTNGSDTGSDYSFNHQDAWWKYKIVLMGRGARHYVYRNGEWNLIKSVSTNDQNSYEWVRILVSFYTGSINWRDVKVYVDNNHYRGLEYRSNFAGIVRAATDVRAPIFYDSANTAYLFDGAATGTSINVAGSIVAAGNVTAYSDIRLKIDVQPIENAIDKVKQINGVTYTRKENNKRQTGVIAQDVLKVLPEAVEGSEESMYSVAYGNMVGLLVEAIKEQQSEIDELKALVRQLLAK